MCHQFANFGKVFTGFFLAVFCLSARDLVGQADYPAEVLNFADKILYNGKILTADDKFTVARAVAIRNGKILGVGDNDRILKMAGSKTEKIDLQGKTVVPGFIDVHGFDFEGSHGGSSLAYTAISINIPNLDQGLREMRETAARKGKPGEMMFFTTDASGEKFMLSSMNKAVLDQVSATVPIVIIYMTHGVVNSQTLKLLPAELVSGPGVQKDEKGEPTGHVYAPVLGYLTYDLLPWPDAKAMEGMVASELERLKVLNSWGVTTMGGRAHGLAVTIIHEAWERGRRQDPEHPLPLRLRFSSEIVRMNPYAEGILKRIGNISGIGDDWFKLYGATLYAAGWVGADQPTLKPKLVEAGNHGAFGALTWGYGLGDNWREVNGTEYKSAILANRYGWPVVDFHANADAEVEIALEAFDKADKERPVAGRRFSFVHGLMRTPEQLQRLAKYDTVMSFRVNYLFYNPEGVKRLRQLYGADAVHRFTPVKDVIRLGMKPIIERDTTYRATPQAVWATGGPTGSPTAPKEFMEKFSILTMIEKVITRKDDGNGVVWGPDQKVTREEGLWMATNWAARFYSDEKMMGTLEAGKLADMVVLGGDYMSVPEDKIKEIPVLQTIVGGKVVYEAKK